MKVLLRKQISNSRRGKQCYNSSNWSQEKAWRCESRSGMAAVKIVWQWKKTISKAVWSKTHHNDK